ncbi:uncharacterized protein LOC107044362 [Diachasma alloeum]|uniref:uncharacterized protein LOC107044362 n=1 Tax=Diachasma alloeum TaxID=454923 RepID=UPI0007384A96|nr:uncharacterized protein LOC107044362 [Diachasma alloeum]
MSVSKKLLTRNGIPLKIHVIVPDVRRLMSCMSLVENYGGELSTIDVDTIVLIEGATSRLNRECFHVNWLYDSIERNKLQEIEKYKISSTINGEKTPEIEVISSDHVKSAQQLENRQDGPVAFSCHRCHHPVIELMKANIPRVFVASNEWKVFRCSSCKGWYYFHPSDDSITAVDESLAAPISQNDNQKSEHLMEFNYSDDSGNFGPQDLAQLDWYMSSHIDSRDSTVTSDASQSASDIQNTGVTSSAPSPSDNTAQSKKKRKAVIKRKKSRSTHSNDYSKEENEAIIHFLIKNGAISKANGRKIWETAESQKLLTDPYRSADGMRNHFAGNLRFNFRKYTNDEEAMKEFAVIKQKALQNRILNYSRRLIQTINCHEME